MNYIGSKLSLLEFIDECIFDILHKYDNNKNNLKFVDLFSGTGVVSHHFLKKGFNIVSNDKQYYSYILSKGLLSNKDDLDYTKLKKEIHKDNINEQDVYEYLNNIDKKKGFIYNNYSLSGTNNSEFKRIYFSDDNSQKCDAIRLKIEEWKNKKLINENLYYYLLASLINSIDMYANTASVYGAFLKKLKKSAQKNFQIRPYNKSNNIVGNVKVFNEDSNLLIKKISGDILYLDPPYNNRQYCDNYHLLETIAKYDSPKIKGKTGIREDNINMKSKYCYKKYASLVMEELIQNANFKYIFLSYNNEGIIPLKEIERIFSNKGKYIQFKKEYKRFKSNDNCKQEKKSTIEYLHCAVVNK